MILTYVKPSELAKAIEFNANKIYMRYGQVVGVTVSNNDYTLPTFVNLIIRPFNNLLFNNNETKTYGLTLSQFQQITFRDYFPELYLFKEIHQDGNEADFDALTIAQKNALTDELNRSNIINFKWIEPTEPSFWNGTETTIAELLQSQFRISTLPTVTSLVGTFSSGIINSALSSGFQTISFKLASEQISTGVYYLATSVNPSQKVTYNLNSASIFSNAEYIGKDNNLYVYKFHALEDSNLEVLIRHSSSFNLRIFNRNPITNYAI